MKKSWLAPFSWPVIVETNRQLCAPKSALHAPTSDGYETTRQLWESRHLEPMALEEATDLCRQCHRLAPFCNYNGNTFVAVIRRIIADLPLPAGEAAVFRSLAGHIVAGTDSPDERAAFQDTIRQLQSSIPDQPDTYR